MRNSMSHFVLSATVLALAGCATAGEGGREVASLEELGFKSIGEAKSCMRPRDIRRTKVLDDNHILFTMIQNKQYMNTLRSHCPTLKAEGRFSYTVHGSNICEGEILTVMTMVGSGPSCSLGEFVPVEAIPDEQSN